MAGTRRGPEGSGRPIRSEYRPGERKQRLQRRLNHAKNARDRVSRASEHLRSVMADLNVDEDTAAQVAEQAVIYLIKLADALEATISRKEPLE